MFSSSHVDLPGVRLVYLEAGRGPLVVLWHGFPDSADTWKASAEKLVARGRRVVMPYLRGYFPSGLAASYDGPALWGDAIGLLDKLGEERATLVGHDWGAFVVQGTAALHPERVSRLVTVAIPHARAIKITPGRVWGARHFMTLRLPRAASRFARDDLSGVELMWRRWSPPGWDPPADALEAARACLRPEGHVHAALGYYRAMTPFLPEPVRRPITVDMITMVGDADGFITQSETERARKFTTAGYQIVNLHGGHFVHRQDPRFPDALADAVAG